MQRFLRRFSSISHIPPLRDFMRQSVPTERLDEYPQLQGWKYAVETFGCQMNTNDSAIVESVLQSAGLAPTRDLGSADVVLLNTCAVREHAEQKVWQRLYELRSMRKKGKSHLVAVLGCMAERLKEQLLTREKLAHIVAGPDAYRSLPSLLDSVRNSGQAAMDVRLSLEETYADICPVRAEGVTASISVMRGCNNMCSFCVVPFTRGRERSRPKATILEEVKRLADSGVKEVMLLGQNVNSYLDATSEGRSSHANSPGFAEMYRLRDGPGARFADLISEAAESAPGVRFRFTSPHPKDFPQPLIDAIKSHANICKQIHLPLQSGSTAVLARMRRGYTREAFLALAHHLRAEVPGVGLSTDVIAGFCGETEDDHALTLLTMQEIKFEQAFMFAYSKRPRTHAANNYEDDVPQHVKLRRLQAIIDQQRSVQKSLNDGEVGRCHLVLVEGSTKRGATQYAGRTDTGKRVVIDSPEKPLAAGDTVKVTITGASPQTLFSSNQ